MDKISQILHSDNKDEIRALFEFDSYNTDAEVVFKFNLFGRFFFPSAYGSPDASFHAEMDMAFVQLYRGTLSYFINAAFRGAAKTMRTKLFRVFVVLNDRDHRRKYLKVESDDLDNAKQIVTDVYNMLVSPSVMSFYPETFQQTGAKREERMDSFTTSTGVKIVALTVNVSQRGALQDDSRPDEILFEDFENRTTLRSGRKTQTIWENMEEARTGLAQGGGCIYNCNYISEQGNVHRLIHKDMSNKKVMIVPIMDANRVPTWSRFTIQEIENMEKDDEEFEGERMCKPSASKDVFFDRDKLEEQKPKMPEREVAGFKIFYSFDASHRYASGHDVAGGIGRDSSTSVFIDFTPIPNRVVATFKSNTIKPDTFGDEVSRESDIYGKCLVAPETNNYGHATIARLKQLDANMYFKQSSDLKVNPVASKEYGWNTNGATKPKMLFELAKAISDGLLELTDKDLIIELMAYTRNDLEENVTDVSMTTRHFDLLIACAIAWQMRNYAQSTVLSPAQVASRWAEAQRNLQNEAR